MNKTVKRIIALTMMINAFSSIGLTKKFITIKAYASETASVYLKDLSLSKSDIDFSEDISHYNVKVNEDASEIKITAKPKSSDASVSIDGDYVDENDNYKKIVSLESGNNVIKIRVDNDNEYKIYTLNIVRGDVEQDNIYLDNINLNIGNINFSKEKTNYNIDVKEQVDKIIIGAIPEQDIYEVTVDGAKANKDAFYKQSVELEKGNNTIIIKVKNKKDEQRTYTLNINRENSMNSKQTQDDIYLDYVKVDNNTTINIDKNKTIYDLNLSEITSQIDLRVEPESTKYKVKINDKVVEEMDNYTQTIVLKQGTNPINITLQDEANNKQRIYTLNINRGAATGISKSTDNNLANNSSVKYNQWIQENNKWKYNDSLGNPLKNTWFHDKNTNKDYYLQADGTMATGWLSNNRYWYYLDYSGARQYGWLNNNGEWYYLDSMGIMKTGWIKDLTGKYYYLNSDGAMVKNKIIDGYKLGADGAWVK